MKSCYGCTHNKSYREQESWEMPHINWMVYICAARPGIVNLKQFPFSKTNCSKWEEKAKPASSLATIE